MGVNLSGGYAAVTQHFLNGTEVSSTIDQMCSEGMPEGMRADVFSYSRFLNKPLYYREDHHTGELFTPVIEKQIIFMT